HTGEYRLMPGKLTAFDTDIHVPLVIAGPGIPAHSATNAIAENVDLAKTFARLGHTTMPGDGHSLIALLHGRAPAGWRDAALVEPAGAVTGEPKPHLTTPNPDKQTQITGNPPSYEAIRTRDFLYVEYQNGQRELYDLRTDRYELHNIINTVSQTTQTLLHDKLTALQNCHTASACWTAEHVDAIAVSLAHKNARHQQR